MFYYVITYLFIHFSNIHEYEQMLESLERIKTIFMQSFIDWLIDTHAASLNDIFGTNWIAKDFVVFEEDENSQ